MQSEYVLYGPPLSLFTRKLEAALRFYGVPFRREDKTGENGPELESRSGTHQVPVLRTPENWMLADTTPILTLMDARVPARRLFPNGPLGVLVHVVEEILDEWTARVMVHYRWHYGQNTQHVVSGILGRDVTIEEAQAFPLAKWGPRACRATGTATEHQQQQAEVEYLAMMDALEAQLAHTSHSLGNRPTAADAILLGGLRAHTNADPIPDLSAYTRIQEWDERKADGWSGGGSLPDLPETTPFAEHVLALGRSCYVDFVLANAQALAAGDKAFVIETYGEEVSYLARPYPERSRSMVQARIRDQLNDDERKVARDLLEAHGLAKCFMP